MLQGDVGSGKTAVAACSALMALESGFNVTLMAPTELLVFNQTFLLIEAWKSKRDALLYVGGLYDVTYTAKTEVRRQRVGIHLHADGELLRAEHLHLRDAVHH